MKTKLLCTAGILLAMLSANAQITQHIKYDWGWSYKLEMPETGLKCEFPEKPTVTTLAYGYMTSALYKDELYVAAKLENPFAHDIACRTEEFTAKLTERYGLATSEVIWGNIHSENGNLTFSGDANGLDVNLHIDAIATEEVLTIFVYTNRDELSVPGHFFANSYSVSDIEKGKLSYTSDKKMGKRAKIVEYDNGRSLVRLENSPVTLEWPGIPKLIVNRNEAEYDLEKNGTRYFARITEVGPTVSYAFFNTFISKEHQKLTLERNLKLIGDETEVAFEVGNPKEAFFRKLTYTTNTGRTVQRYYVAAENKIIVQELETSGKLSVAETRFLNTFEQSVRNEYDTNILVVK